MIFRCVNPGSNGYYLGCPTRIICELPRPSENCARRATRQTLKLYSFITG